jgi:hypothetical protein
LHLSAPADGSRQEQDMTGIEPPNEPGHDSAGDSVSTSGRQIEVSADEDWKSRVKAEDAAFDQQFRKHEPEGAKAPTGAPTRPERDQSAKPEQPTGHEAAQRPSPPHSESQRSEPQYSEPQLPEPSLAALLGMLSTQAMVALGLIANPASGKAEKELPLARYFIDLISVLETKTAGNLDRDEAAALDETLHTLRMAYVQRSKETA